MYVVVSFVRSGIAISEYLYYLLFPLNYINYFYPLNSSPKLSYKFPLNLASFRIISSLVLLYIAISFYLNLSSHSFLLISLSGLLLETLNY